MTRTSPNTTLDAAGNVVPTTNHSSNPTLSGASSSGADDPARRTGALRERPADPADKLVQELSVHLSPVTPPREPSDCPSIRQPSVHLRSIPSVVVVVAAE